MRGLPKPTAQEIISTPIVTVELDKWDWNTGTRLRTIDITKQTRQYTFQKSIKGAGGSGSVTLTPIIEGTNGLNKIDVMDVVRIKEYGTVKFMGYVETAGYSASVGQDGKITRNLSISIKALGNMLSETAIGLNLGVVLKSSDLLATGIAELEIALAKMLSPALKPTYKTMLSVIFDNFFGIITKLGVIGYQNFFNTYFELADGVDISNTPLAPKTFRLYNSTDDQVTLWGITSQLIETPLMEMWTDVGKRTVTVSGVPVACADGKTYIIVRNTPYNGTTFDGRPTKAFDDLPETTVIADQCISMNLSKSKLEAYSIFMANTPAFNFASQFRQLLGNYEISTSNLNKYLYKPLDLNLFFTRKENEADSTDRDTETSLESTTEKISATLKAWFEKNDQYLSGTVKIIVPKENDVNIGTKVNFKPVDGLFYCEGITHNFTYPNTLTSDLLLTRGVSLGDKPIKLNNRLFITGLDASNAGGVLS